MELPSVRMGKCSQVQARTEQSAYGMLLQGHIGTRLQVIILIFILLRLARMVEHWQVEAKMVEFVFGMSPPVNTE